MTLYFYDVTVSAGFDFARWMVATRAYADDYADDYAAAAAAADADAAKATL